MRPINIKNRCTKKKLKKSDDVVRLYDEIQIAYADKLDADDSISVIECNLPLENFSEGKFASDFVCIRTDGEYMVRECVFRKKLSLPRTVKLLDASRDYWNRRGVSDWGIVAERSSDYEKE